MILTTKRLTVRPATDEEMRAMIEAETDEGLRAAYGEMLECSAAHPAQRQWYAAWLIARPTGERIGDLCFKGLGDDGAVEIGYGLLPAWQGKGYATEAVTAAVAWAAAQPGVRKIEAETEPDNAASQRVLAKVGFLPTGENGEEGPRFVWGGFAAK